MDFNLNDDTFKFSGYSKTGGTLFIYPVSTWNGAATFPADIPGMVGNVIFGDSGDASGASPGAALVGWERFFLATGRLRGGNPGGRPGRAPQRPRTRPRR